ncbi:MAG: hypothetical protein PHD76_03640 [Methylacidiphilales bacterium]|nr:hypothetical protein [Candidatus Methylacidiphilales bacterium]
MKTIHCLILACVFVYSASAEVVGQLSFAVPKEPGWGIRMQDRMPGNVEIKAWSNGPNTTGITLISLPLPPDSKSLEEYVPKWRTGFEKKAEKVDGGGIKEINGKRFGFSKIVATIAGKRCALKQYCVIAEGKVYMLGVSSAEKDPEQDVVFRDFEKFIEFKESANHTPEPTAPSGRGSS